MLEKTDIPINNILPTHCERTKNIFEQAINFAKQGGNIYLTAGQSGKIGDTASQVYHDLNEGVEIDKVTISSDGRGIQPIFNESMQCLGFTYTMPYAIHEEIKVMINEFKIRIEDAISIATINVAKRLGIDDVKGTIKRNADTDIQIF